jgi:hypothetical protein
MLSPYVITVLAFYLAEKIHDRVTVIPGRMEKSKMNRDDGGRGCTIPNFHFVLLFE